MTRAYRLLFVLAVGSLAVVTVVVAVCLAADEPSAQPQQQMVRFVSHLIIFMPKDPSIMRNPDPKWFPAPTWYRHPRLVTTEVGLEMCRPLHDVAPELGPFDALKGRNPEAVADWAAHLDDRWDYHVLTLSESGPMGHLLAIGYRTDPIPLKTAEGARMGQLDNEQIVAFRVICVDRTVGERTAIWRARLCISGIQSGGCPSNSKDGAPGEVELGAPIMQYAQSAGVTEYRSPAGGPAQRVVLPGLICVDTVELGAWAPWRPPAYH